MHPKADMVCDFFNTYPYPPGVTNLKEYCRSWKDEIKHRKYFHPFSFEKFLPASCWDINGV